MFYLIKRFIIMFEIFRTIFKKIIDENDFLPKKYVLAHEKNGSSVFYKNYLKYFKALIEKVS